MAVHVLYVPLTPLFLDASPWIVQRFLLISLLRHPQDCVVPLLRHSKITFFTAPQSHTHSTFLLILPSGLRCPSTSFKINMRPYFPVAGIRLTVRLLFEISFSAILKTPFSLSVRAIWRRQPPYGSH